MVFPVPTVTTFPSVGKVYVTTRLGAVPIKVKLSNDVAPFSVYGMLNWAVACPESEGVNWTTTDSEPPGLRVTGSPACGVMVKLLKPKSCGWLTTAVVTPWYVRTIVSELV
jgi:hypothetical protein